MITKTHHLTGSKFVANAIVFVHQGEVRKWYGIKCYTLNVQYMLGGGVHTHHFIYWKHEKAEWERDAEYLREQIGDLEINLSQKEIKNAD